MQANFLQIQARGKQSSGFISSCARGAVFGKLVTQLLPRSRPLQGYMAAFGLLFSPRVLDIRFASARYGLCTCLHVAVCENHADLDDWRQTVTAKTPTDLSDLLNTWFGTLFNNTVGSILQDNDWTAYLNWQDFVRISESSHCGLNIAILLAGRLQHVPCAHFLNHPITDTELWQSKRLWIKTRFKRANFDRLSARPHCAKLSNSLSRELFWAKLQFQISRHVSHSQYFQQELTVKQLLRDIGIKDGHRHLNISAIPLLTSVQIPDRRYWQHWWRYWKHHTRRHCEPSERNVVLGILTFSLYVACVCDTCKQELETQGYRIHCEHGVPYVLQHRRPIHLAYFPAYSIQVENDDGN